MVAGDTGIALQNRATASWSTPRIELSGARKRPSTHYPAMLFRDGRPVVSFGVMAVTYKRSHSRSCRISLITPQRSGGLDYPRFHYLDTDAWRWKRVEPHSRAARPPGHDVAGVGGCRRAVSVADRHHDRSRDGMLLGGSDRRKDGCAIGF